jgi:outer membrane lipoprotein SlyB
MSAFLNEYYVTPTVSGVSIGSISVVNVSGGTGPWVVSWSGATVNGYVTSTLWDQTNLSEGLYRATITDANGNVGIFPLE